MIHWLTRSDALNRFWKRFVDYAKIAVCVVLIVFLFQTIVSGAGAPLPGDLLFRAGIPLSLRLEARPALRWRMRCATSGAAASAGCINPR